MWTQALRKAVRQEIIREVTVGWPQGWQDAADSGDNNTRIYPIWQKTALEGEFDHLREFVDPSLPSVDVGALLGQYSLLLAAWSDSCLCIEPLVNYAFVGKLLPPNCTWITTAVGGAPGTGIIQTPDYQYGLSSLVETEWISSARVRTEQVTMIHRLDDLVAQVYPEKRVGFIKIDVEGYELPALFGAAALFARDRPNLQVEIQTQHVALVRQFMENYDYQGLFYYDDRLHAISQFDPTRHRDPKNAWSLQQAADFDPALDVENFYFIPDKAH